MHLGLDISTSITGATVLDDQGNMIYNRSWDTRNKKKFPTLYDKAVFIKSHLIYIEDKFHIDAIFIEQSLQSFRSGFSSAKTLSTLSRFNGIISWLCYDLFGIEPEMFAASSARKLVGVPIKRGEKAKEKVFQFVIDEEPSFLVEYTKHGNPRPGMFDKSDSYVIAKAGYINWKTKN
jgi:hypothetical protein